MCIRYCMGVARKPLTTEHNMYEVTFIDTLKTVQWTEAQCHEHFGKAEFLEILQGYAPHIVAVRID